MTKSNIIHDIALTMVPDIGPVLAKTLISYCGSAEAVMKSTKKELSSIPGIGDKIIERIQRHNPYEEAYRQVEYMDKIGAQITSFYDKDYPRRMKNYDNAPLVIYHKGHFDLNAPRTVAIVGTRSVTERGRINCEKLVSGLKDFDVQIISGLAYGVDTCAHQKSVDLDIPTIGVVGHGLDRLYPATNKNLVKRMFNNGGLLTEFPINTRPDRENFPMRNRIIAAMSDAVVIIESKRKGGSIITAEIANTYFKDVFAISGRIDDEFSQGCNNLIKQNKAHLIESAKDIAYIMMWEKKDAKTVQTSLFVDLSSTEQKVIDLIRQKKKINVDVLNYTLRLPPSELAGLLLEMEFKGVIKSLPGKNYMLI